MGRLRAFHEAWARALLGVVPQDEPVAQVRARVEAGLAPEQAAEAAAQLASAET